MPRSGVGTYTLPLATVVSGTAILASWANTTMADIATALTDSLSRTGQGSMSAALGVIDGVLATPGLNFSSESGSGIRRAAAGDVRHTVIGTDILKLTSGGIFANKLEALAAGSLTAKGAVADGASAVGVILDNLNALSTTGAKIASFRHNAVEKAFIDKDGLLNAAGGLSSAGHLKLTGSDPASSTELADTLTPMNIVKAWAQIVCSTAGVCTIASGFNVASASYSGHIITLNFAADFTGGLNGVCVVFGAWAAEFLTVGTVGNSSMQIVRFNHDGTTKAWANGDRANFAAFGAN